MVGNSPVTATPAPSGRFAVRNPVRKWSTTLVVASAVYLAAVAAYAWCYVDQRVQPFALPRPSTVGDFLAGVFSPLAFLWLVYGYFLQSAELEAQREQIAAMREAQEQQARELARAADAQEREAARADEAHLIGTEPDIVIESRGLGREPMALRIKNYGATARSLDFFSVSGGWNVAPSSLGSRTLRTGDSITVEVSSGGAPSDDALNIELVYTSATDGTARRRGFSVSRNGKVQTYPAG